MEGRYTVEVGKENFFVSEETFQQCEILKNTLKKIEKKIITKITENLKTCFENLQQAIANDSYLNEFQKAKLPLKLCEYQNQHAQHFLKILND